MKRIYLDYASLTPIDKRVMKEIKKYSSKEYSNPSALYSSAIKAKNAIIDAKNHISSILHAHPDEIIFTSGGTESNNLVLQNEIIKNRKDGLESKIIISSIEHSSIIKNTESSDNKNMILIPVDKNGIIDLDLLKKSITPETTLVSVMLVNNEIGSIEPIHDIAKIVRDARKSFQDKNEKIPRKFPLLHTDASQAGIHLPLYVEKLGIDLMTLDGSKIYGPRGIGMLYVKRNSIEIERNGTENVPAIMGFTMALEIADKMREKESERISKLRSFFIEELLNIKLPNDEKIKINGDIEYPKNNKNISPHILNISIPNIDNEFFVLQLDANSIECSTKSACLRDEDESFVLKAIGANSRNSVRFSFGRFTTKMELKKTIKVIKKILTKSKNNL